MKERRRGVSPIPAVPFRYLTKQQINGLKILKEFGWGLVCVRRRSDTDPIMILRNCQDKSFASLSERRTLKLSNDLIVRDPHRFIRHL